MPVAVKNHALPVYKKKRIVSLLCIFESTIARYRSLPIIQTLHNDCSLIENILLFCTHFMNIFQFLRVVEHRHFFFTKMLR